MDHTPKTGFSLYMKSSWNWKNLYHNPLSLQTLVCLNHIASPELMMYYYSIKALYNNGRRNFSKKNLKSNGLAR